MKPSQIGKLDIDSNTRDLIDKHHCINKLLTQHRNGDYGLASADDIKVNESSLASNDGVVTSIHEVNHVPVLIKTHLSPYKWERSTTIIILEYLQK